MNWPRKRTNRLSGSTLLGVEKSGGFLHPLDPPLTPRMATEASRDAVYKLITELHSTGALDAGNGDVADAWIDSLKPQWLAHHRMVSEDRAATAQLALAEYEAVALSARAEAEAQKADCDRTRQHLEMHAKQLFVPREVEPLDRADLRRRTRPTLSPLEGLTPQRMSLVVTVLLLLLAAGGDLASFYVTLAGMLEQSQGLMVWILTVALTAAAIGVMHQIGRSARNLREHQGGLGRWAIVVATVVWLALGATAFYVRTRVSPPTASAGEAAFGADPAATSVDQPLLSALLLGALFLASGVLAFWLGFSDHHPRMRAYRRLRGDLVRRELEVAKAEKRALQAERLRDTAREELDRTAARAEAAEASVDAEIAELKELARLHLAGLVGQPAATNNLVTGRSGKQPPADEAHAGQRPPVDSTGHDGALAPFKVQASQRTGGNASNGHVRAGKK